MIAVTAADPPNLLANRVLQQLPERQRRPLIELCGLRELSVDQRLTTVGQPGAALLFPLAGLVSMSLAGAGVGATQLLMLGSDGVIGSAAVLASAPEALLATVSAKGFALSLDRRRWRQAMLAASRLGPLLQHYQSLQLGQIARSAVCLGFHEGQQRLARWLLDAAERSGEGLPPVTHERLGHLLGLRRSGVTVCAGRLQAQGLIDYRRGQIRILDLAGLKLAACPCYQADRLARAAAFPRAGGAP